MVRRLVRSGPLVIATTVTEVLKPNPRRVAYSLSNSDTNNVHLTEATGDPPTTTYGDMLEAGGGDISDDARDSGEAVQTGLRGIATTAPVTIYVREWEE